MDELKEQIEELRNQLVETDKKLEEKSSEFGELKHIFDFHEHKGYDLSKEIDIPDAGSTVYAGYIDSAATAEELPTDWTVTRTGNGQYTVTHNLGTTSYAVSLGIIGSTAIAYITMDSLNANDFKIVTWDSTPTNTDKSFTFLVEEI